MIKKTGTFFILLIFVILISGCGTVKGAINGFKEDWQALKKVDDWVKKNMW